MLFPVSPTIKIYYISIMNQLVGGYSQKEWFLRLTDEEKKYIIDHPDPSHMIFYLKQGLSFKNALMRGYKEYALEDKK